jgi:nicotinamide mononucleotide transporter
VVDVVCCWLYISKGLYPTAALYGLYALLAVFGYRRWLQMMRKNDKDGEIQAA